MDEYEESARFHHKRKFQFISCIICDLEYCYICNDQDLEFNFAYSFVCPPEFFTPNSGHVRGNLENLGSFHISTICLRCSSQ